MVIGYMVCYESKHHYLSICLFIEQIYSSVYLELLMQNINSLWIMCYCYQNSVFPEIIIIFLHIPYAIYICYLCYYGILWYVRRGPVQRQQAHISFTVPPIMTYSCSHYVELFQLSMHPATMEPLILAASFYSVTGWQPKSHYMLLLKEYSVRFLVRVLH